MKVIVFIDIKIIMSIHIITTSLSATQLAELGAKRGGGQHRQRLVWGGEGQTARYASASDTL